MDTIGKLHRRTGPTRSDNRDLMEASTMAIAKDHQADHSGRAGGGPVRDHARAEGGDHPRRAGEFAEHGYERASLRDIAARAT